MQRLIDFYLKQWQQHPKHKPLLFLATHLHSPYGVRFSMHNYSVHDKIRSYPLYSVAGAFAEDKKAILSLIE